MRPPVTLTVLFTLTLAVGAGCSGEEAATEPVAGRVVAETMIAGDLATEVGLGPLTPACTDPGPLTVGSVFTCTATPGGDGAVAGSPIQVEATVNPDGRLALATTNLITAEALPSFERAVAARLNESVGADVAAESVDCGTGPLVLPADAVLGCALTVEASGEVFDVTLIVTDLDGRVFDLNVSPAPRP